MSLYKIEDIDFLSKIKKMEFNGIKFKRGFGIIEDMFILSFIRGENEVSIEIESNFRIRDDKKIFLVFNDLYIDKKGKELSVRRYRSQIDIEKTYLKLALDEINGMLKNSIVENIITKEYGDIFINFNNSITVEISNDTHLDKATLYRIIDTDNNKSNTFEIVYNDGKITISSLFD